MKRVLIIGGGELARQINHYIKYFDNEAKIVGFVDDTIPKGSIKFNIPSLGQIDEIYNLKKKIDYLIIGIGYKHLQRRKEIFERFICDYPFYSFIHPRSFLDQTARVGRGVIIGPGVLIEQRTSIEDNVFIYNSVSIAHDTVIGAHSFLTPNVSIAGFVSIGSCCSIGINTTIIDNIQIADGVQTGGGTVVIDSIRCAGLYVGNPAKFIK